MVAVAHPLLRTPGERVERDRFCGMAWKLWKIKALHGHAGPVLRKWPSDRLVVHRGAATLHSPETYRGYARQDRLDGPIGAGARFGKAVRLPPDTCRL